MTVTPPLMEDIPPAALGRRYPEAALPQRLSLIPEATPVAPMAAFSKAVGGPDLWIKDEGHSAPRYGGNKPRKLEYWLAGALQLGFRRVMTMGGLGSNHCLATTLHAHHFGLTSTLILGPQPMAEKDRRNLMAAFCLGADIAVVDRYDQVGETLRSRNYQYQEKEGREPFLIPAGGSGPLGVLGMVNAFLELAEQIDQGLAPRPESIYVPVGTCGTLAGLILGARLVEFPVRFVGVQVTPPNVGSRERTIELANQTAGLLRRSGVPIPRGMEIDENDFILETGYLGDGYAEPIEAGIRAVALLTENEGITLEQTYTSKALAAMVADAQSGRFKKPMLFWNTFNSVDYWGPLSHQVSPNALPAYLRQRLGDGASQ